MYDLSEGVSDLASKNHFYTGLTEMLLMSILAKSDSYIYEITKEIENLSDGTIIISPNTIYTAAYKLEQEGIITERPDLIGKRRIRIYYHLEPKGVEYLDTLVKQYRQITKNVGIFFDNLNKSEQ
jgi:PadR family transcriptional regulator PadR